MQTIDKLAKRLLLNDHIEDKIYNCLTETLKYHIGSRQTSNLKLLIYEQFCKNLKKVEEEYDTKIIAKIISPLAYDKYTIDVIYYEDQPKKLQFML